MDSGQDGVVHKFGRELAKGRLRDPSQAYRTLKYQVLLWTQNLEIVQIQLQRL